MDNQTLIWMGEWIVEELELMVKSNSRINYLKTNGIGTEKFWLIIEKFWIGIEVSYKKIKSTN